MKAQDKGIALQYCRRRRCEPGNLHRGPKNLLYQYCTALRPCRMKIWPQTSGGRWRRATTTSPAVVERVGNVKLVFPPGSPIRAGK